MLFFKQENLKESRSAKDPTDDIDVEAFQGSRNYKRTQSLIKLQRNQT